MNPAGRGVMPMIVSWKQTMGQLAQLFHSKPNQPILLNQQTFRLDMLENIDGAFDEYGDSNHKAVVIGLANLARPAIMWLHPGPDGRPPEVLNSTAAADSYFQQLLHLGLWPALPVKYNDHLVLPSPLYDGLYESYGPLFSALSGKEWLLLPHAVESVGPDKALTNIFRTQPGNGVAVAVTFGYRTSSSTIVAVRVGGLDLAGRVVLLGGRRLSTTCTPYSDAKGTGIKCQVPLERGCGMLLLRRKTPTGATPARRKTDDRSEVFRAGDGGCVAFRIPALVAAGGGALLAFAECRKWTCNDFGRHDLVMKRSTNNGVSFGPLITLLEPNSHWTDCNQTELPGVPNDSEGGTCFGGCAVWDPTAVADNATGAVWLWFGRSTSSCPESKTGGHRVDLWALHSSDRGQSWAPPKNMTAECSAPYGGGVTGSGGHGIKLRESRTLLVPLYGCGADGGQGLCVSENGSTWAAANGTTAPATGSNGRVSTAAEGEVVELFGRTASGGPRLLYDTRPVGAARCTTNTSDYDVNHQCRLVYTSDTIGGSWSPGRYLPELPDPSCKG
jgi:sialidase-1